jgi:hypothetical protein
VTIQDMEDEMHTTSDGYCHSWSNENEDRWEAFRLLVQSGADVEVAAEQAGITDVT